MEKKIMERYNNSKNKLNAIKIIHTIICVFFVSIIFYILYSGIFDKINSYTWISIIIILIEGIILFINKWNCPLTILGKKFTGETHIGFDIYLPKCIARNNKIIFTTLYLIGLVIIIYRI